MEKFTSDGLATTILRVQVLNSGLVFNYRSAARTNVLQISAIIPQQAWTYIAIQVL